MPLLAMEGWVLKGIDYSETSRIVTLWTKEKGKIRALAKGARRLKSPFENALDLLNLCRFQVIHKGGIRLTLLPNHGWWMPTGAFETTCQTFTPPIMLPNCLPKAQRIWILILTF